MGGMLWLKQNDPGCCLWPLQPQPSHNNTSGNVWKTLGDLMLVATVCHCNGQICELTTLSCPPGSGQDKARFIKDARSCCSTAHLGAGAAEIWDPHSSLSPHPSQLLVLLISKLVIKVCSCCTFLNWHLGPYSSENSH